MALVDVNNLVLMVDGFGFALFAAAFYFGFANYKRFDRSRVLWALFNIAMFIGILMALYSGLEWMGFYPLVMDEIEGAMTLVLTVLLFTFAVVEKEESNIAGL